MKAATAIFAGGIAAAAIGTGWLVYVLSGIELEVPKLPSIASSGKEPDCSKATPLTAPTLVTFYDFARGLAVAWKPDVVLTRLDHLAMSAPLQVNGSSRLWTAGFYSPSTRRTMLIHTGDAKLYCSTVAGDVSGRIPKFKGEPMLEGSALYRIAEKHGKAEMKKGLGVGIYLWADPDDNHAAWHVAYYDKQGYAAGPTVIVDASTGAVEKIEKSR